MAKKRKRKVAKSATKGATYMSDKRSVPTIASSEFNPDYSYIIQDLKRIAVLAVTFFIILVVLSFILK